MSVDNERGLIFLPIGSRPTTLWRGPQRRQSLQQLAGCLECGDGKTGLVFSDGSSRYLGLRHAGTAGTD